MQAIIFPPKASKHLLFLMNTQTDFTNTIDFIAYIDQLKSVIRRNGLHDGSRAENTAEHSWHAAMSAQVLAPFANEPVDVDKVSRMLLIHDLVEIEAGDTFIYDEGSAALQEEAELKAAEEVFGRIPAEQGQSLKALWEEFEARETPEAKFAKAIDRFLPLFSNARNTGYSWMPYKLSRKQVVDRCWIIQEGSQKLWELTEKLLDESIKNGSLDP
jgi:putative hydrolase of HD superfamily